MTHLNQDQKDKLRFEIAAALRDAAVYAEAAASMEDPHNQEKALLDCIAISKTATDHARYLRGIVTA